MDDKVRLRIEAEIERITALIEKLREMIRLAEAEGNDKTVRVLTVAKMKAEGTIDGMWFVLSSQGYCEKIDGKDGKSHIAKRFGRDQ